MPQEVRVDALRFEPGLRSEAAQDEKDARAGQRAAARVEEELLLVAALEERAPAGDVEPEGFRGFAPDRDDAFLAPLPHAADKPMLEIDGLPVEGDRLADAQSGSIEELAE